uniref:Uncharacterized protein n=1 Tax=Oryza brachyantha TaxID=4533 RepID=J3LVM1_ORYBR
MRMTIVHRSAEECRAMAQVQLLQQLKRAAEEARRTKATASHHRHHHHLTGSNASCGCLPCNGSSNIISGNLLQYYYVGPRMPIFQINRFLMIVMDVWNVETWRYWCHLSKGRDFLSMLVALTIVLACHAHASKNENIIKPRWQARTRRGTPPARCRRGKGRRQRWDPRMRRSGSGCDGHIMHGSKKPVKGRLLSQ